MDTTVDHFTLLALRMGGNETGEDSSGHSKWCTPVEVCGEGAHAGISSLPDLSEASTS